uniref:SFRICE_036617 n=1 Tax=Spodoptera frugiperda TaxID=7108 RepID=A0A2H1WRE0_SPOFR
MHQPQWPSHHSNHSVVHLTTDSLEGTPKTNCLNAIPYENVSEDGMDTQVTGGPIIPFPIFLIPDTPTTLKFLTPKSVAVIVLLEDF